jgi:hypothetical protein
MIIEGILRTGAIGRIIKQFNCSCIMGPPKESEWPVDPVGVAIIIPSILKLKVSFKRQILNTGVLVKLVLIIKMSFKAGPNT